MVYKIINKILDKELSEEDKFFIESSIKDTSERYFKKFKKHLSEGQIKLLTDGLTELRKAEKNKRK